MDANVIMDLTKGKSDYRMATVVKRYSNSDLQVRFDGEDETSPKLYSYLKSLTPKDGTRVLMLKISGTYIIVGEISQ